MLLKRSPLRDQPRSAAKRLGRLRRKLTLALAAFTLMGLGILASVTVLVDANLRSERSYTELQGYASRAAALAFVDEATERWNFDGVLDDSLRQEVDLVVIVMADGETVLSSGEPAHGIDSLVSNSLSDAEESGVRGEVILADGRTLPAAAAPFFEGNEVTGVVVVAAELESDPDHNRLVAFVLGTAAALTALSALGAWLMAGRVVKPLGQSLDREEAFLATAAHQLRTPIGRSRAVAESAILSTRDLENSPARTRLRTELRRLVATTTEASQSINDLLLLGRIEADQAAGRAEPLRLDQMVADFEATFPELAVDTAGPVEIVADPALVSHAITNLLANSQRHGRRDGSPLLIEASVFVDDDEAVVSVTDNGPGPSKEMVQSLFDRYQTGGQGTGLGLWIVKLIMDQHGGTVTYRSPTEDRPHSFELRWPIT